MKKLLSLLSVLTLGLTGTLTVTACGNKTTSNKQDQGHVDLKIKQASYQSSSLIKALIMGKEQGADTAKTLQDMLAQYGSTAINNKTQDHKLETWTELSNAWGANQKISTENFNVDDYFTASGTGSLFKQISEKQKNNVNLQLLIDKLSLILNGNLINNNILYKLLNMASTKSSITNFLNETKKKQLPSQGSQWPILLKNAIEGPDWAHPNPNNFQTNIIPHLESFLNYVVDGCWSKDQASTPKDINEFKTFMNNWKDPDGKPYSQWNDGSSWKLGNNYYKSWTPNDFNFYRSGTLINYLFYKIGKDYNIAAPGETYQDRYLGDIITSHIEGFSINMEKIEADFKQYIPHLLTNPEYVLILAEALVPLVKQWGLKMTDITQGLHNLNFGVHLPTNNNDVNVQDILNNINELLNNPEQIQTIIKTLIGWAPENTIGKSFAYDIKVSKNLLFWTVNYPLSDLMKQNGLVPANTKQDLVDKVMNLIPFNKIKGTFADVLKIYEMWIKQYDKNNQGFQIDLRKIKDLLSHQENSLVTVLNKNLVPTLYKIMTDSTPMDEQSYQAFYQSLGIQADKTNFSKNSIASILADSLKDKTSPLYQIMHMIVSTQNPKGIINSLIDQNNNWIASNYTNLFDPNATTITDIYNIQSTKIKQGNKVVTEISYNLKYIINNHIYYFWVKCSTSDVNNIKNLYFNEIKLNNIESGAMPQN